MSKETAKPRRSKTARPPRGRPKSAELEQRLHQAALDQLLRHGLRGITVEKIAEAAGVPRTTFYRRWQNCSQAVVAAIEAATHEANPIAPDTGNVRSDLIEMATNMAALLTDARFGRAVRFLIAEMDVEPEFRRAILAVVLDRRRLATRVLQRGIARGELSADVDIPLTIEMLSGALYFRAFFGETAPDRAYAARAVDAVLSGA